MFHSIKKYVLFGLLIAPFAVYSEPSVPSKDAISTIAENTATLINNMIDSSYSLSHWARKSFTEVSQGFPHMPRGIANITREVALQTSAALVQLSKASKDIASWMADNKIGGAFLMTAALYTAYKVGILHGCAHVALKPVYGLGRFLKRKLSSLLPTMNTPKEKHTTTVIVESVKNT